MLKIQLEGIIEELERHFEQVGSQQQLLQWHGSSNNVVELRVGDVQTQLGMLFDAAHNSIRLAFLATCG